MQQAQVIVEETVVQEFTMGFGGAVMRHGDEGYDTARAIFNGMFDRSPALITRCGGVADVIAALAFARANNLPG